MTVVIVASERFWISPPLALCLCHGRRESWETGKKVPSTMSSKGLLIGAKFPSLDLACFDWWKFPPAWRVLIGGDFAFPLGVLLGGLFLSQNMQSTGALQVLEGAEKVPAWGELLAQRVDRAEIGLFQLRKAFMENVECQLRTVQDTSDTIKKNVKDTSDTIKKNVKDTTDSITGLRNFVNTLAGVVLVGLV